MRPLLLFILILWRPIAGLLLDKMTGCGLQEQLIGPVAAPAAATPKDSP
jgi:hypothetical protein